MFSSSVAPQAMDWPLRVVSSFALGANTLGVSFEKEPAEEKTASAGWYNNIAFDQFAKNPGFIAAR